MCAEAQLGSRVGDRLREWDMAVRRIRLELEVHLWGVPRSKVLLKSPAMKRRCSEMLNLVIVFVGQGGICSGGLAGCGDR